MLREVAANLERLGIRWYLTGSEALAAYGTPRQTMDTDLILEATDATLDAVATALAPHCYWAEPLRIARWTMASLIDRAGGGKVDLIVRDPDPWGREAMLRRRPWEHPAWGPIWVSSLEDLVLAKLEWSEGVSELQLRDCATLLRMNAGRVDRAYLARWAEALGLEGHLRSVEVEATDAT